MSDKPFSPDDLPRVPLEERLEERSGVLAIPGAIPRAVTVRTRLRQLTVGELARWQAGRANFDVVERDGELWRVMEP